MSVLREIAPVMTHPCARLPPRCNINLEHLRLPLTFPLSVNDIAANLHLSRCSAVELLQRRCQLDDNLLRFSRHTHSTAHTCNMTTVCKVTSQITISYMRILPCQCHEALQYVLQNTPVSIR